jgi:hypothetical protein
MRLHLSSPLRLARRRSRMPKHRPRYDGYAYPLPELAPAQRQSFLGSPQNQAMRRYLIQLLEHEYQDLFRRGVWTTVMVSFEIHDGTMQDEVSVELRRRHRKVPQE